MQITPTFGNTSLQTQTVQIVNPFTDNQVQIPVGALGVMVSNDSSPTEGATILVQNEFGGKMSTTSGPDGGAIIYLPSGQYNVTVTNGGQSESKNAMVSTGAESELQFSFKSNPATAYLQYLLVSTLIIGILLSLWFWIIRPKRRMSF
jgi:hypothetical protein